MNDFATLDRWAANLRALPKTMTVSAAPELAAVMQAELTKTIAAGESPNGDTWAPKKDGGKPLVNAASHISVSASGARITALLSGPDVFHHFGTKRVPRRQILPTANNMPASIAEAFRKGLVRRFRASMGKR